MTKTREKQLRTIYQDMAIEDLMASYETAKQIGSQGAKDHMKVIEEIGDEIHEGA